MFTISHDTAAAFHASGLRSLRRTILAGWQQRLADAGTLVGEAGRAGVLARIDAISLEDPSLTVADLTMLADLMLVDAANGIRRQAR